MPDSLWTLEKVVIRKEIPKDYLAVFQVITKAFESMEMSDHREQFLVDRLRKSASFIPDLSLVAVVDEKIVGHILLTKLIIRNQGVEFPSLALAPVSVLPNHQGLGIGSKLIRHAHNKARELGYTSVVLIGHEAYYPKFGYRPSAEFGIKSPYDIPPQNNMVLELVEKGLAGVTGIVEYPKEFEE